jgi:hypothetical protein
MKLVRLISNKETEADYTCMLQEPITLEPNSKICLQNLSLFLNDIIEITSENRGISLVAKTLTTGEDVVLSQGIMNIGKYEILEFVDEVARALNIGLNNPVGDFPQETNFMEITTKLNSDNQLVITYNLANTTDDDHITLAGLVNDGANNYTKPVGPDPDAYAFMFSNLPATMTNGQLYCETELSADNGALDGCVFGLANWNDFNIASQLTIPTMPPASYTLAAYTEVDTYRIKKRDGTTEDTDVEFQDGDVIQFAQGRVNDPGNAPFESLLIIQVKRADGNIVELYHETSRYNQLYHYGVSLLNATDMVRNVKFVESVAGGQQEAPTAPFNQYRLVMSDQSAELLGFNTRTTGYITGASNSWTALNSIYSNLIPSSIVVEIPTLPLLSYDTEVGYTKRRPLLGVIPSVSLDVNTNSIAYSTPFPVFIDINNKNKELLNTIRVRVLDTENEPLALSIEKGATLSVILDN